MTATAPASVARKRILCIDDDEDTRDMMRVLLGGYGYDAVLPVSVSAALESARSGGIALCILDHWLTETNGIELCQQIRAFDSDMPIMFYSGAGYRADIQTGLDAGAQAYLVKPDFENLKPTIDRLIEEAGSKLATSPYLDFQGEPVPSVRSLQLPTTEVDGALCDFPAAEAGTERTRVRKAGANRLRKT